MTVHVLGAGIATETNVFSPMPTGLADFAVARPRDEPEARRRMIGGTAFDRFAQIAASKGCEYVQGTYAWAAPAGVTSRVAYERLRDVLLEETEQAGPLDAVLLNLHGAMVADGYEDCETDIAARVREIVGPSAKLGILLDLHCDIPHDLVRTADVIITYKEYPHTDINDRADELASLVLAAAVGEVSPVMAVFDCRMLGLYPTSASPMAAFVARMRDAEQDGGVLSVSLGHGFPWGDAPEMGARVVAIADQDAGSAAAVAARLGRDFFDLRREVALEPIPLESVLDRVLGASPGHGPFVVADVADNAGGGAASDSTFVLRALMSRKASSVALGPVWDPLTVHQAQAAGVGAQLTLRLGGKMGPASGDPLDVEATVKGLVPDLVQRWPQTKGFLDVPTGASAWLAVGEIDVIVTSLRQQALGLELFTAFGIDPAQREVVVVKSANHFYAAYAPLAREVIYMDTPGALSFRLPEIPHRRLDTRKYPWVDDPWSA